MCRASKGSRQESGSSRMPRKSIAGKRDGDVKTMALIRKEEYVYMVLLVNLLPIMNTHFKTKKLSSICK